MYVPAGFDALLLFNGFPVLQHLARAAHLDLTKDVWMTTNQFGADVFEDITDIKITFLHAEIARQEGDFNIGDVFEHVSAKLIRRHPHVFGQVKVSGAGQVLQNWEAIKQQERIEAGRDVHTESLLDGVPLAAPALIVSQEYQKRAARLGFDYPNLQRVLTKLTEELQELQEARTLEEVREEMGDVLFMVARAARELKVDAEE